MSGCKLTIEYGVMAHRKIKYENGKYPLKKLTSGLRFESFLFSKTNEDSGEDQGILNPKRYC